VFHLHFEIRRNDQPVDPTTYLAAGRRLARFMTTPGAQVTG